MCAGTGERPTNPTAAGTLGKANTKPLLNLPLHGAAVNAIAWTEMGGGMEVVVRPNPRRA